MKILAPVMGILLFFVGTSIGLFGGDRVAYWVGLIIAVVGVYLTNYGLSIHRRWQGFKERRSKANYTLKGGGM